jgi:hypothetical protein
MVSAIEFGAAAWRRQQPAHDLMKKFPESVTPTPKISSPLDLRSPLARFLWIPESLLLVGYGSRPRVQLQHLGQATVR